MTTATKSNIRIVAWLVGLAGALLTGCTTLTPVDGSDAGVFLPSLRVAWELGATSTASSSAQPHSGRALEFFAANGAGESTQDLAFGQAPIQFGGIVLSAPQTIREQFDVSAAAASFRWRKFSDSVGIELIVGLGYGSLDTTLDSGAQRAHESRAGAYLPVGLGFIWNVTPSTSLQGRTDLGVSSHFSFNRNEIAVAQAWARHMTLRVGLASWVWDDKRDDRSDAHFKLSGPSLGLDLEF